MAKEKKRLILLDAHAILHRAYHALPEFANSKGEPTGALYGLASMLIKIIADIKPDYMAAAYDLPKATFRHAAYKDYKAGRPKADDELVSQMKRSREIFEAFNIPIYDKEGFEADDILGTIVEQLKIKNSKVKIPDVNVIIASGDMDTLQLVDDDRVQVYTLKKGINDTILYNEERVQERFGFPPKLLPDYKGLRGDPSDNIIGIKGIGEKTGSTLIQTFGTIEQMYKALKKGDKRFKEASISERIFELLKANEEEAEFSKMLATIRRDAPITFVLPEKTWRETLDMGVTIKLFTELEFRALGARFAQALVGQQSATKTATNADATEQSASVNQQLFSATATLPPVDPKQLSETSIALWLTNSNMTNPTLEDIMNFSSATTFEEARTAIFKKLTELGLDTVFSTIEKPLIDVVSRMNEHGIVINADVL
ncbi:MAG: hypothetical protein NUV54_03080, partial [Candidatus Taylorbacteria bacterium]|nr:hypothetical protein [Candidatus Taylorbacteria bacterium]